MQTSILSLFLDYKLKKQKKIAYLVDPDKFETSNFQVVLAKSKGLPLACIFVGGSFLEASLMDETLQELRKITDLPLIIFPGNCMQVSRFADAILFMSLISGRNPDLLIGQQVLAAPLLAKMPIEIIPTGYLLIENDRLTTAHYMSNTLPLPRNKPELAKSTVLAGKYLGLRLMYLDTGSGANETVPPSMLQAVSEVPEVPIIAGGGVKNLHTVHQLWNAGADIVVIGSAIENNDHFFQNLVD